MITEWKLFNFKSVADETSLKFRPLTLFAGPNSSGKSTCIQSILLICQTLRNPIGSRPIILNGTLERLGQLSDLKTSGSAADQVLIGWELQPAEGKADVAEPYGVWEEEWVPIEFEDTDLTSISCEVAFDAKTDIPNDPTQLTPQLFSTRIRATFRDEDGVDHIFPLSIVRTRDGGESTLALLREKCRSDEEVDRVRTSTNYAIDMDQESVSDMRARYASGELVGAELTHFLPRRISLVYNRAEDHAQIAARTIFTPRASPAPRSRVRNVTVPPSGLLFLDRLLLPVLGQDADNTGDLRAVLRGGTVPLLVLMDALRAIPFSKKRQVQEKLQSDSALADEFVAAVRTDFADEYRTTFLPAPRRLQSAGQYMRRYFSQAVKYLGPLRDEPKALYPLGNATDPFDIGLKGENTAAVLDLHKDRLVRFIPPSAFAQPKIAPDSITRTLEAAISEWLRYLGVAENAKSRDLGKLGHELKVTIDNKTGLQDLTHVGVGLSQVLPILVMCLLADADTVLLFEQPELHLHPKVQTLLGDFFLSMALMEKQCVIETHSEYLINRLRFRAAAAESDRISSQMTIYFVEKKEGKSHFRSVVVNEFGAIHDWPEGFFDQSQREAEETLKAAMQKKRQQAESRKL